MQIYEFEDKTNDLDKQFADCLKAKSVAVVGVSGLDDLEQGEHIDSHDIVARVHSPIPYPRNVGYTSRGELGIVPDWKTISFVPDEWQSRVGSRCNIFYHKEYDTNRMTHLLDLFHKAGGKFLSVEYAANLWAYSCCQVRKLAPCRYLTNDHFLNVTEVVGDIVYAGSLVIGDILRHDIKSLYITGFPTMLDRDGRLHSTAPRSTYGMGFKNFDWLRQLWRSHEEITTDSNMRALFEIVPNTWEEYYELHEEDINQPDNAPA